MHFWFVKHFKRIKYSFIKTDTAKHLMGAARFQCLFLRVFSFSATRVHASSPKTRQTSIHDMSLSFISRADPQAFITALLLSLFLAHYGPTIPQFRSPICVSHSLRFQYSTSGEPLLCLFYFFFTNLISA